MPELPDLAKLLRECVAQIGDGDGFRGSGFFVAPGLVVSCAHVVDGASGSLRLTWQSRTLPVGDVRVFPAQRGSSSHYPLPDLALLHVVGELGGQESVWLGEGPPTIGAELVGLGFSSNSPAGVVATDSILVTTVGPAGDGFIKVKDDRVPAGMSGSPLLDRVSGRVCGMLKASRDYARSEGGWIVPADVIVGYLPEAAAANTRAHPPGEVWRDLATDRAAWTRRLFGETDPTTAPNVPRDPRPSWWLEPHNQVVDFHPRPELEKLKQWWQDGTSEHLVRLVTAPGGVGKTRLGLQLCHHVHQEGGIAGLLRSGASLDVLTGDVLAGALTAGHRVLAVIDYAETFIHDLPQVVASLLHYAPASVRVLLLARNTGHWWDTLTTQASCSHLIDPKPLTLPNLSGEDLGERQAVLTGAYRVFKRLIPADQTGDDDLVPEELLAAAGGHRTVLSLHALALSHVLDRQTPHPASGGTALHGIVAHERRYWQQIATRAGITFDSTDRLADHVLLVPTLYPARNFADAETTLTQIPHLRDRFPGRIEDLAVALASVYPNTNPAQDRYWDPMQPDRLGETLLAEVLANHPSDERATSFLHTLLTNADIGQAVQTLTVLVRTSGDATAAQPPSLPLPSTDTAGARRAAQAISALLTHHPAAFLPAAVTVAATIRAPVRLLSRLQPAVTTADASTLQAAAARLPYFRLDFAQFSVELTELLVHRLRQQHQASAPTAPDIHTQAQLASSLNNLSSRLAAVGRREEALAPIEEAVAIRRQLAQTNPSAYLHDLVRSLNNLGNRLAAVGRREEALTPAEEAVEHYLLLAQDNLAVYWPDVARSLTSLGVQLNAVGRREEALTPIESAVAICRVLSQATPAVLPDLALSLNSLGVQLAAVGRREEALAPIEEAVAIHRLLSQANPAAYLPDLALSLTNLGIRLNAVGRREEAVNPAEDAVEHCRQLAQANPAAYLPDLARSLASLGVQLAAVGRREEALAPIEEAVAIHRLLSQANPAAYLPDLALSLTNLGNRLNAVGRREEALSPAEDAVEHYRRLAQDNPAAYLPNLALSLNNFGNRLSAVGRREKALAAGEEAVEHYRRLAQDNLAAYLPDLAGSLTNLGVFLDAVGRPEQALAPAEEAVAIRRRLAQDNPAAYLPDLAGSLTNLGACLDAVGKPEEAEAARTEVVSLNTRTE